MRPQDILLPAAAGLCCKPGGFHIDPVRAVERAVITHGHSDHARPGHGAVLATQETLDMMRLRYGDNFAGSTQAIRYGEEIRLGDVKVKFHPAGHVLGSAQIAVTCKDTCIVASATTRTPRPDLRAVRSGALRRLHHRGDVRPAGVSPWRSGG
jgi:putative mRNA 3-end processing factor